MACYTGHYVTDAFEINSGKWMRFNDSIVSSTTLKSVLDTEVRVICFSFVEASVLSNVLRH